MEWAREQARMETEKYEQEKENYRLPSIFIQIEKFLMARNAASMEDIFPAVIYYQLNLDQICRKIRTRHNYNMT